MIGKKNQFRQSLPKHGRKRDRPPRRSPAEGLRDPRAERPGQVFNLNQVDGRNFKGKRKYKIML